MSTKVRKTLTLDPDVVEAFERDESGLSATVNTVLRQELERRDYRAGLDQLLDRLDSEMGPPDPDEVARFEALLRPR